MKKLLLLSTIVILWSVANGQTNTYFQNNPVWQDYSSCASPYPCIHNESYNFYLNGDTIFNTLIYKKVFRKGQGSYNWMAPPPIACSGSYWYIDTVPSYFLRSDAKQIFLRQPQDTSEYLLYDFNLSAGDTLPITYNNPLGSIITITTIDSIYTPNGILKRFALTGNTSAQYLIEGIGSSNGLLAPIPVVLECGYSHICFSLNDTAYYPSTGPACSLSVGINTIDNLQEHFFSPNPFSSQTVLRIDNPLHNATLTLFNSSGQPVKQIKNISEQTVTLSRENLANGFYFFRFSDDNKIFTGKLVITE